MPVKNRKIPCKREGFPRNTSYMCKSLNGIILSLLDKTMLHKEQKGNWSVSSCVENMPHPSKSPIIRLIICQPLKITNYLADNTSIFTLHRRYLYIHEIHSKASDENATDLQGLGSWLPGKLQYEGKALGLITLHLVHFIKGLVLNITGFVLSQNWRC